MYRRIAHLKHIILLTSINPVHLITNQCCHEYTRLFDLVFWVTLDKYLEVEFLGPSLSFVIAFVIEFVLKSFLSGVYFSLYLQSVCIFQFEVSLDNVYKGLVLLPIQPPFCLLTEALNSFALKVIVNTYVFTAILLFILFFFLK